MGDLESCSFYDSLNGVLQQIKAEVFPIWFYDRFETVVTEVFRIGVTSSKF